MAQRIAIIGAGLIGSSLAFQLARRGAAVTVIESGLPGQQASGRSFGWLNASFFADEHHFHLRMAGMEAWRRLKADLPELSLRWPGSLWWEGQGEALQQMRQKLGALDYPVDVLPRAELAKRLPDFANLPEFALGFPAEGVAETGVVVGQLLQAAQALGAQVMAGVEATDLVEANGKLVGIKTDHGIIAADQVVVTAGVGSAQLVSALGISLPMLRRPAVMLQTRPLPPLMSQIVVTPEFELRQDSAGRLILPTSPSHQSDDTEEVPNISKLAEAAQQRLQSMLPEIDVTWEQVTLARRPVPLDGLPVIGATAIRGLYLAVMHSGATLAAICAEIASQEILDDVRAPMLRPYRPERYADSIPA